MSNPKTNPLHSKATPRWGTPADIVDRARRCMGGIDLDPCTEVGFELIVGATQNYSLQDRGEDGLVLPWYGCVLCNPPGGLVRAFWRKLLAEHAAKRLAQCVWVGFSVEQFCVLADEVDHPLDFPTCILRKRLDFTRHDGHRGSPTHGNYVTGVGISNQTFINHFRELGKIV